MTLLFVYGTLKQGECRSANMSGNCRSTHVATMPNYRMYRIDDYPGLIDVRPQTGLSIIGELWEVDSQCLERLDEIEGVAEKDYERRTIQLASPNDSDSVQAYFYLRSIAGLEDCDSCW